VSFATDWPYKPEHEPPVPKPNLRDFFRPGEPPEPVTASSAPQAPHQPIWPEIAALDLAEAAEVQATAAKRARLRARWAQNKYELAQKLVEDDVPRIIAMLRFLDARLEAGKWISLRWPLHREKSRPLSQPWKRAFKTAARLLHLIEKRAKDERGKSVIELYLGRDRDVWSLVRLHLGFIENQPPDKSTEELLGFKPLEEIKLEREQFEREIAFECALAREDIELKFKGLSAGTKLTKQSEELARKFADELGPAILLSRIKSYLCKDCDLALAKERRRERERLERTGKKPPPAPQKHPSTGKEMAVAAKNLIRRQILRQQASW
jgi:hypothetical protein